MSCSVARRLDDRHALGKLLLAMGELTAAGEHFDAARAIRSELGEKPALARVDLARATLLLELGRAAQAQAVGDQGPGWQGQGLGELTRAMTVA